MVPIPVKVKNVTVYAYFNPHEPLSEVIIQGAAGTYSVGTLGLNIFYNLDLTDGGKRENPLNVHGKYVATFETESGSKVTSPWMFCLDNSDQPKFGRTVHFGQPTADMQEVGPLVSSAQDYIKIGPLTDIKAVQILPPPQTTVRPLIADGKGFIIATRTGAPHLMGVQVDSGERLNKLVPGIKGVAISGRTAEGHLFAQHNYTIISGDEPAIFLKTFPA